MKLMRLFVVLSVVALLFGIIVPGIAYAGEESAAKSEGSMMKEEKMMQGKGGMMEEEHGEGSMMKKEEMKKEGSMMKEEGSGSKK